jgi:predicted amidohydrolase
MAQLHSPPSADPDDAVDILARVVAALASADGGGAPPPPDLLVLPETWLSGYPIGVAALRARALPLPGSCADADTERRLLEPRRVNPLARVAALAASSGIAIALAFVEREAEAEAEAEAGGDGAGADSSRCYNTLGLWGGDGALAGVYRKTHLWGPSGQYEKVAFTPGPGFPVRRRVFAPFPAEAAGAAPAVERFYAAAAAPSPQHTADAADEEDESPFVTLSSFRPVTLPSHPSLPLGLLVCFDLEFPEPARILAARGARVLIASTAMGERNAFASRVVARARAAENHVCVCFSNFPSSPVPLPSAPSSAFPGALTGLRFSGGTCVVGPDGRYLHALDAVVYSHDDDDGDDSIDGGGEKAEAAPALPISEGSTSRWLDAKATAAVMGALRGHLGDGEEVFVVTYDPDHSAYVADAQRNPYLMDRRVELFAGLLE